MIGLSLKEVARCWELEKVMLVCHAMSSILFWSDKQLPQAFHKYFSWTMKACKCISAKIFQTLESSFGEETLRGNGSLRKELKAQNTFKDVIGVLVDLDSLGSADVVRNEASWCSWYLECVAVVVFLLVPGGEYVMIFASFIFTP